MHNCPPPALNSSNCQDSRRVSQQGFEWLFACISRVHLIFHFGAAMRCFYYLCNADTNTLRSGSNPAALSPSLPSLGLHLHRSQVAEHFATFPLQFSVLLSSGFECTTQTSGQGKGGGEGASKGVLLTRVSLPKCLRSAINQRAKTFSRSRCVYAMWHTQSLTFFSLSLFHFFSLFLFDLLLKILFNHLC